MLELNHFPHYYSSKLIRRLQTHSTRTCHTKVLRLITNDSASNQSFEEFSIITFSCSGCGRKSRIISKTTNIQVLLMLINVFESGGFRVIPWQFATRSCWCWSEDQCAVVHASFELHCGSVVKLNMMVSPQVVACVVLLPLILTESGTVSKSPVFILAKILRASFT